MAFLVNDQHAPPHGGEVPEPIGAAGDGPRRGQRRPRLADPRRPRPVVRGARPENAGDQLGGLGKVSGQERGVIVNTGQGVEVGGRGR